MPGPGWRGYGALRRLGTTKVEESWQPSRAAVALEEETTRGRPPPGREPTMQAAHPQAKSIFGQALAIEAAADRAAYLEQACGGDGALRAEVECLLAALANA